jgi:hypothetical protein
MLEGVRIRTQPWIRHYDSVLFLPDEYFYVYQGQAYKDTDISEFINSPELMDHAYRTGFLVSRLFRFFGDEFIWCRFVGAFLGAFAAAFVCLAAQEFFSKETSAIVSLIAALAPQMAFYSIRPLKEIWVVFAASLMVFGFTMIIRNKKPIAATLLIMAATALFAWIRPEYGLMFTAAVPIAICFRHKNITVGKIAAVLLTILLGAIVFVYQSNKLTQRAERLFDKYTITKRDQRDKLEAVKAMDTIHKSRGPLRLLNIPLAILNPPPRNLHHIYTTEKKLFDIVVLSDIYQWWLPLPFLIIGSIVIITKRIEFLAFLLRGLRGDILRYRDSLAPVAFIIIGVGIESLLTIPKNWKNRIIIAVYAGFVICAVVVQAVVYT